MSPGLALFIVSPLLCVAFFIAGSEWRIANARNYWRRNRFCPACERRDCERENA